MLICTIILQIIAKKIAGTENITVHMNPGIQIVVVHQVTGVYLCKCNFDFTKEIHFFFFKPKNEKYFLFTAMMILHIIDQDEKLITEISNLRGITVQARNHMPTILPIITILVIIMDMGEMKGDMIGKHT